VGLVLFQWTSGAGAAKQYQLDASVSEVHSVGAQVTEQPVEVGSPASDHIRPMPRRLRIDGFVTNTPISNAVFKIQTPVDAGLGVDEYIEGKEVVTQLQPSGIGPFTFASPSGALAAGQRTPTYAKTFQFSQQFDRVKLIHGELVQAIQDGVVFTTIWTALDTYLNMAAISLDVPQNVTRGSAIQFTIEFQEIRFVTTSTVTIQGRTSQGHKPNKTLNANNPAQAPIVQSVADAYLFGKLTP
jgi:hypothetical protein